MKNCHIAVGAPLTLSGVELVKKLLNMGFSPTLRDLAKDKTYADREGMNRLLKLLDGSPVEEIGSGTEETGSGTEMDRLIDQLAKKKRLLRDFRFRLYLETRKRKELDKTISLINGSREPAIDFVIESKEWE